MGLPLNNFDKVLNCSKLSDFLRRINMSWFESTIRQHPVFQVNPSQVNVYHHPREFYQELLSRSSSANKRIHFASLYLGIGDLENKLVSTIHERLRVNPQLQVRWLLDYTRASRGQTNSRTVLLPLLKHNSNTCQVALYHTPRLRGFLKWLLPERWNEIISLQHMKVYIFDDSVLISGANLSNDYFTNRQDRYVVIEDCRPLADFYSGLLDEIHKFSFKLHEDDTTTIQQENHPYKQNYSTVCDSMKDSLEKYWKSQVSENSYTSHTERTETLVIPTMQIPQANITYDSDITLKLLEMCPSGSRIHLASGYFNLTKDYVETIVDKSGSSYDVLAAHPSANGFLGAKGFSGAIPSVYTYFLGKFHDLVSRAKSSQRHINLFEYKRNSWTFHAKGLWFSASQNEHPGMTMVGSPNFGYRSVHRDMESQLIIITEDPELMSSFKTERDRLFETSDKVLANTLHENDRYVPIWVRVVTYFMRGLF